MLLSLLVVAVLGSILTNSIRDGILGAKRNSAVAEAVAGGQSLEASSEKAPSDIDQPAAFYSWARPLVNALGRGGGAAGSREVLLVPSRIPDGRVFPAITPPDNRASRVPAALAVEVARGAGEPAYAFIEAADGPALAVGETMDFAGGAPSGYDLYYIFPLDREVDTLNLVRNALAAAGLVLIALVGLIVFVVARSVVTPVRMAARIAERLAAGRLEERMLVRGEDDLARLAASFNKMATNLQRQIRALEDLSRVQRRFVSDVSHELRTPLTTVRMAADMLHSRSHAFSPDLARSSELLQTQLERFEEMLSDLLEISRFDAGAAVLEMDSVDLRDVARRVLDATEPLAERRGSRLELLTPTQPCCADADAVRIERIVRNLVVNAIEHGEGNPIVVSVATDARAVSLSVRDSGVGLRPGESAMVFARFWRADPSRARHTGGTGLGLSIALEDAHLHGGWLQAWGKPGVGAQFRLTLPIRAGDELVGSPIPLGSVESGPSALPVGAPYLRTGESSHA